MTHASDSISHLSAWLRNAACYPKFRSDTKYIELSGAGPPKSQVQ